MSIGLTFTYRHLFDENRPQRPQELVSAIPSKFVIGMMAIFNETLTREGANVNTQLSLLNNVSVNFPELEKKRIRERGRKLILNNYELFALPFTVEFINRELFNYRDHDEIDSVDFGTDELNIFKAYLAIMDEQVDNQTKKLQAQVENAKEGGINLRKLLWPHIVTQFEFTNRIDPLLELFKSQSLVSYLERHEKFGKPVKDFFESLGYDSGKTYLYRLFDIMVPHLMESLKGRDPDPGKYFYRILVKQPEPAIETLVLNPADITAHPELQLDYLGLKKKPILKFTENEYIVPYWDYLYSAVVTGLLFFLYEGSSIKSLYEKEANSVEENQKGFRKFKGTIGKEFSEGILFKNTMIKCFSSKHAILKFFNDNEPFNPDCYYRIGKHIFIFEYKDYLLNSEIIHSGSYERIKASIDEKFIQEIIERDGKIIRKDKGVFQLARHIEALANNSDLFWQIDDKAKSQKLKIRNMIIYPIIVQTSLYFDMPDVAEYLNESIQERLRPVTVFKSIAELRMIDFKYFFDKMLMFSDQKLSFIEEIENYVAFIKPRRRKVTRTRDPNDWLYSMTPFSFVNSAKFKKLLGYRQKDVVSSINECWQID